MGKKAGYLGRSSIELQLKLLKVAGQKLAAADSWSSWLEKGWQSRYAIVRGNVYQKALEVVTSDPAAGASGDAASGLSSA